MSDSNQAKDSPVPAPKRSAWLVALGLLLIVFGTLQLKHLSHPLLWQDEGETAMFARRVLEFGYPKVSDGRNVVYGMGVPLEMAVRERSDAYIGSLWGQYYFATLGVALADRVDDPHAQAARVRLPFALAGGVGLLLIFLSWRPLLASGRHGPWPAALAYLLLLCLSTSLILHQREARYYPLVVGLLGAVLFVHERQVEPALRGEQDGTRACLGAAWLTLLLIALFNVFYPAAVSLMIWLGARALWLTTLEDEAPAARLARGAPIWIALAVAAAVCIPIALFFEIPLLSRVMSERWSFGWSSYFKNLGLILQALLRFEMLAPLLLAEAAVFATRARGGADGARRRSVNSLLGLCVIWILVGARNPIFFERYFVPLSPLLSLAVVLDGLILWQRLPMRAGERGAPMALRAGVLGVAVLLLVVRWPELHGRVVEVFVPYRGPVDLIVEKLRSRSADPAELTIATNYESEPLMFHLGSRVIGRFHAARDEADTAEASVIPDVVIPRGAQPKRLAEVRHYLVRGGYQPVRLPIADWPYNNVPELSDAGVLVVPHRFRTPEPAPGRPPLLVYVRDDLE